MNQSYVEPCLIQVPTTVLDINSMCVCTVDRHEVRDYFIMAGGLARTLQFMDILFSGESSAYTVSSGSSSNMGPKPVASSKGCDKEKLLTKTIN